MPRDVEPGDVLARSHADCEAYWDALGPLTTAQKRWRMSERVMRVELALAGDLPADWLIPMIRSGKWEKRQQRNMQNLLRDRARLAMWKREGYSFDEEHRLVAPARREPVARPRERRARRRTTARRTRAGASRDGPGESDLDPPLEVLPLSRFRRDVDAWLGAA
jgi:hypothetical protein